MQFIFVFVLGVCLASYIMVLCQSNQNSFFRRSQCDRCGLALRWYQLVPLYSSLIGCFRCSKCQHQPSTFYGIIELGLGLIFTLNAWVWPLLNSQVIIQLYSVLALHIIFWDWRWKQIPLMDIIFFCVLTILWIIFYEGLSTDLIIAPLTTLGMLLSLTVVWNRLKKPWILAKGDWILLVLASCWITAWQLPIFLGATGSIGILTAVCYQHFYQTKFFPFAPAILMALWLTLLWG